MKKYIEILLGLILVIGMIYFNMEYSFLWNATKTFLIGGIVIMITMIGLGLLLLGISEFKK